MKKLGQIGVFCSIVPCDPNEITRHTKTILEWNKIFYEIVGYKSMTAPASHYIKINWAGRDWAFREIGDKSQIMKAIKNANS